MATDLRKQGLLLLRQALDNSTANFRLGQWEAIEELLQQRSRLLRCSTHWLGRDI